MSNETTINYSAYSDEQLLSVLSSINRHKYKHNYLACKSQIESRQANGLWTIQQINETTSILKLRKIVRVFSLVQALGGIFGIGNFLFHYGPHLIQGRLSPLNSILLLAILLVFALTTFAAWRYWKTEKDRNGLWRNLVLFQIPVFSILNLTFEFYSGFKFLLGFEGGRVGFSTMVGADVKLIWDENIPSAFYINVAALFLFVLLARVEMLDRKVAQLKPVKFD